MIRFVCISLLCAVGMVFQFDYVIQTIGAQYQKSWHIFHYDYANLDNPEYIKKLSYGEKVVCHRAYYDQAMQDFLEGKTKPKRELLHWWKRRTTESIWIGDRHYVIKTGIKKGFFPNLLKIGLGVEIWNNAHLAKELGIPTLQPIAFWEKRCPNYSESIVLYPWEGTSGDKVYQEREDILPAVEKLLVALEENSVIQRSFRLKNLVILSDNTPQLIDIDDMHRYPKYSFIFHKRLKREIQNYGKERLRLRPTTDYSFVGSDDECARKSV